MVFDVDSAWVLSVFLVSLRIGVVLMVSPIFTTLNELVTVRVLFALALGVLLASGAARHGVPPELAPGPILAAAVAELLVGGVMAFGAMAAFAAFGLAGHILDVQSGFGMGSVYDPVTGASSPLFVTLFNLLGVAVFFGMDGHHAFMRGIVFSLDKIPPGAGFAALPVDAMLAQFGLMFSLAVSLIIPVTVGLFLVDVAMGVMARVLPQMNLIVVGTVVKVAGAMALFAATLGGLDAPMGKVYLALFQFWEKALD